MNVDIDISKVVLETPRMILRPFQLTDLDDFFEYASVPDVGERAGWPHHQSIENTKFVLNMFMEEKKTFAIVLKENNKVIGSIGIEKYNEEVYSDFNALKGREIGYVLSKAYWGQGLMPEAVKEVIRYCFSVLKLDFLTCGHFKRNDQSRRVIEKCLFKPYKEMLWKTIMGTVEETMGYILRPNEFKEFFEKLTIFDENGNDTGKWIYRGDSYHYDGYHGVVDAICKNQNGKYLLTRRDLKKRTHPGLWEVTGGAIQLGENPDDSVVRELKEETGIDGYNFKRIGLYVRKDAIYFTYLCECNTPEDYFVFQEGETIDYKWVTKKGFIEFFEKEEGIPAQSERFKKILNII